LREKGRIVALEEALMLERRRPYLIIRDPWTPLDGNPTGTWEPTRDIEVDFVGKSIQVAVKKISLINDINL